MYRNLVKLLDYEKVNEIFSILCNSTEHTEMQARRVIDIVERYITYDMRNYDLNEDDTAPTNRQYLHDRRNEARAHFFNKRPMWGRKLLTENVIGGHCFPRTPVKKADDLAKK